LSAKNPKLTPQAAHDALPSGGGRIVCDAGTYVTTASLVFTKIVAVIGAGKTNTLWAATGHDLFSITTDFYYNVFENIGLAAAGGHVFNVPSGHSINLCRFTSVAFTQNSDTYSVVNMPAGGMVDNLFQSCDSTHTLTASVPSWYMVSSTGALNNNMWLKHRHTNTGVYGFHLEGASGAVCNANTFKKVTFEVCNGGCVRILSGYNNMVEDADVWDLSSTTTHDLFVVDKSATGGGVLSSSTVFRRVGREGGTLGGGLNDIKIANSGDTLIDSLVTYVGGSTRGAWRSYTPTIGGSGAALGNGTIVGQWTRIGRTIHWYATLTRGSTTTYGSGIQLGLPVASVNDTRKGVSAVQGQLFRTGVNWYALTGLTTTTVVLPYLIGTSGAFTAVTDTVPSAGAAGDTLEMYGTYQAAA
jgi:hypothetical protein